MNSVQACELPQASLLRRYKQGRAYVDCYVTEVSSDVSQAAFVEAFYTTRLFKLERLTLKWLVHRPSTDIQAAQLAHGRIDTFAAWRVVDRTADQLLLGDFSGRTKSWLMVAAVTPVSGAASGARTRLYFGSAVVARVDARSGSQSMGFAFHALLGFHKLYSSLLLQAARTRVMAGQLVYG